MPSEQAIQVSPEQGEPNVTTIIAYPTTTEPKAVPAELPEDENMIHQLFGKIANSIVEATHLRRELNELKAAMVEVRQALAEVSADRNKAWAEVDRLRGESEAVKVKTEQEIGWRDHSIQTLREGLTGAQNTITALREEVAKLVGERDEARKDRDDTAFKLMKVEDDLVSVTRQRDDWRAKAEGLKEALLAWKEEVVRLLTDWPVWNT